MTSRNGSCSEDPGKRQAILEQAIRTFAELGFRGADVQVIADRAGVGKGTVYRYFHSKEDLFWATTYEVCCGWSGTSLRGDGRRRGGVRQAPRGGDGLRRVLSRPTRSTSNCSSRTGPSSAAPAPSRTASITRR